MPLAQAEPTTVEELLVLRGDLRGVVAGWARYPDLFVTCSTIPRACNLIPKPLTVFEVVSRSTEVIDRDVKADESSARPATGRCAMLAQTVVETTILSRNDARASGRPSGRDAIPQPKEFNVALPLAEVYRPIVLDD